MQVKELKILSQNINAGKIRTLKSKDKFQFKCTACGKCCFNIDVMVGIYDLVRLRNATKLTTQELLKKRMVTFYLGPASGIPILIINFLQIDKGVTRCPFLVPAINFKEVSKKLNIKDKDEREKIIKKYKNNPKQLFKDLDGVKIDRWLCSIHKDRPIICRLFPLGRLKKYNKNSKGFKEKFFLQKRVDWCAGWETKEKQTLKSFLDRADFWQYKDGSDKSHEVLDLFLSSGFFLATENNKKGKVKALFEKNSVILMFVANLIYNFDSINYFSQDKRVVKTIHEKSTHEDFLYVVQKINEIVSYFIKMFTKQNLKEEDFNQFINNFLKKGVNIDD